MLKKCNNIHFSILLSALFSLLACQVSYGLSVVEKSLEQLLEQSDEVIYGLVTEISSRYDHDQPNQQIYTYIQFSETKRIKNSDANARDGFVLRIAGGRVGSRAQVIPGAPKFDVGERYILFVKGNNKLALPIVGVNQGVFSVVLNAATHSYEVVLKGRPEEFSTQLQMLLDGTENGSLDSLSTGISPQEFMEALSTKWRQGDVQLRFGR